MKLSRYPAAALAALVPILVAVACAPRTVPATVVSETARVRLERLPVGADLRFQHPQSLTAEQMALLLDSLRVQDPPGFWAFLRNVPPPSRAAFGNREIEQMARPLAEALSKAGPDERVAFVFRQPRSRFIMGTTSGVLFAQSDRLHLILGRYHSPPRPHEPDPTLDGPALPLQPYNGFQFAAAPNQAVADTDESAGWGEPVGERQWVILNLRAILAHPQPPEPFPTAAEPAPGDAAAAPAPKPSDDIKQRLRTLKELRDEGLITEDEYAKKRKQVLEGF